MSLVGMGYDAGAGTISGWRCGEIVVATDVLLLAVPGGSGPWNYDPATMLAIGQALPAYKVNRCALLDARTQTLLSQGFVYKPQTASQSYVFGLDPTSVANWTGMAIAASGLTYPFTIAAVDGTLVNLASAADVNAFYAAGVQRSAAIQQAGISLKAQVMAATTQAQVDAVVDTRT